MNIAIMFNGQFRWFDSFKRTFEANFKPSINNHNVQYFAHFWNEGIEKLPDFINLCNPIIIDLENKKSDMEVKNFLGFTKPINGTLPNQTYCAYKVFLLLEEYQQKNNMLFDLYIRMRPDLAFIETVNFDNFDSNSVYTKKCHAGTTVSTFLCDFAYFTKSYDTVQKIAQFGKCLDATLDRSKPLIYTEYISENIYCPEELLARHVSQMGLSAKLHDFNIDLARHHV